MIHSANKCHRSAGFTLLEVLVVVLITGIMTGLVVFRLGADKRGDPNAQLQRLAALTEHWCQRAVIEGTAHAVRVHEQGYDFWVSEFLPDDGESLDNETGWQPLSTEPAFAAFEWSSELRTELLLQGQSAPLDSEQPQIVCFASSELTPFALNLRRIGETGMSLEGNIAGQLKLVDRDR